MARRRFKSCKRKTRLASSRTLALALTTGLLLVGCASQPNGTSVGSNDAPLWVEQTPSRSGYAYGVGSMEVYGNPSDALQRAADLARADLVSQLKVIISSDFDNQVTERSGTGRDSEIDRLVSQQVRSQVQPVELEHGHILEP